MSPPIAACGPMRRSGPQEPPQSSHDVVIPSGITVTNTGLATTFINSLTISGTLTHAANASTETHKLMRAWAMAMPPNAIYALR